MINRRRALLMTFVGSLVSGLALVILTLAGCSKATEPFKDSDRAGTNSAPADTGTMPDGFSNWSTKCDHGNRIYVAFHGDSPYAAIAVVPQDPTCRTGGDR